MYDTRSSPLLSPDADARAVGVLVVDDHDLIRLGLRALMGQRADVRLHEARTLQEALALYRRGDIDVVLLDLHLPDAHGLTGLTTFLQQHPRARVVILSGDSDPQMAQRALAQGASAYLPKSGDLQCVMDHLRLGGSRGLPRDFADTLPPRSDDPRSQLSPRQTQVLEWLLAGHANRDIAERLHISEGTVKNHVSSLLLIFGVRSRAELISVLR
ncbi:response regulator [Hydrogenophaga sp. MI9]|uniref:response regulator n=1 Tax=Hydrogenophaga sp. MI9 TaxID=3453719 RepID=UPI003EECD05C